MLKEALEDYRRYQQDKELNRRSCTVVNPSTGEADARPWHSVHVGDIILVRRLGWGGQGGGGPAFG